MHALLEGGERLVQFWLHEATRNTFNPNPSLNPNPNPTMNPDPNPNPSPRPTSHPRRRAWSRTRCRPRSSRRWPRCCSASPWRTCRPRSSPTPRLV
eukprot:scaffold118320_cov27-Phaeocystis_antarctica.AAC.2